MGAAMDRSKFNRDTQEGMAYLAEQTGGFAVRNTNDLAGGLGRITNDIRGYYVIGYTPQTGTFAGKGETPQYRKLMIAVKRRGPYQDAQGVSWRQRSARRADDDNAGRTAGPRCDVAICSDRPGAQGEGPAGVFERAGKFVRMFFHIDARGLTFTPGDDGRKTASADVLGMVFDQEGAEVGHLSNGFSVALTTEAADEALRDGLATCSRFRSNAPAGISCASRSGIAVPALWAPWVNSYRLTMSSGVRLRSRASSFAAGIGRRAAASATEELMVIAPEQALSVFRPGERLSNAVRGVQRVEGANDGKPVARGGARVRGSARHAAAAAGPGEGLRRRGWARSGGAAAAGQLCVAGRRHHRGRGSARSPAAPPSSAWPSTSSLPRPKNLLAF